MSTETGNETCIFYKLVNHSATESVRVGNGSIVCVSGGDWEGGGGIITLSAPGITKVLHATDV